MPKGDLDPLFQLIKTLTKAEKRAFKLEMSKTKSSEESITLKVFDYIDKREYYEEEKMIKAIKIKPRQISNIKGHLYKLILQSIRHLHSYEVDIEIRELLDHATILHHKCLYESSRKILDKAKALAQKHDRITLMLEIADFDKFLITKLIRWDIETQVEESIKMSDQTITSLNKVQSFKGAGLKIYAQYLKTGFIRNKSDFEGVSKIIESNYQSTNESELTFEEKINYYRSQVGYYFFIQDFTKGLEISLKWLTLFEEFPEKKFTKMENYVKAINNLAVAQSKLYLYNDFRKTIKLFDSLTENTELKLTPNIKLLVFKYKATALINSFFIEGKFSEGIKYIPKLAEELAEQEKFLDQSWKLIFYYKFACMYYGASERKEAIYWLSSILNERDFNLRSDILIFTRILNLICHWELGHDNVLEYYLRSTYRFIKQKGEMTYYQKILMKFIRKAQDIQPRDLRNEFNKLKEELLPLTRDPYEKRAFVYFDIISWLESKTEKRDIQEIIQSKVKLK